MIGREYFVRKGGTEKIEVPDGQPNIDDVVNEQFLLVWAKALIDKSRTLIIQWYSSQRLNFWNLHNAICSKLYLAT